TDCAGIVGSKTNRCFHIAEQQVDGTSDYLKDGEWPIDNGTIEVYAAPPVPVVPEEKPMPNPLSMYAVDAVAAIAEVRGWNACRAAMLHGAEPVSQTYKSQHTQFEQVADLYEMQFDDGRTCAFHTDAQKAAQWLQACDGNRVQEYVKLERLRNALSGNSPVTPDGWVMVPKEPTQAMIKAWLSEIANFRGHAAGYRAALEAAPQEVNRG
ncbi:hypothetical protein, partial [Escherichia coli]|uniref:hypothetical protein n=1 Tax=Escherichia coli TaxID=562 RepID=UPI00208DD14E